MAGVRLEMVTTCEETVTGSYRHGEKYTVVCLSHECKSTIPASLSTHLFDLVKLGLVKKAEIQNLDKVIGA